jgi:hypothetical protein
MLHYQLNSDLIRDFILDDAQKNIIWEKYQDALEGKEFERAKVHGDNPYSESRFCENFSFNYKQNPEIFDISSSMLEFTDELAYDYPEDLWFAQYEFVKYDGNGETFKPHQDDNIDASQHNRLFTSVTMVDKTDDLEGGHLYIWPKTRIYDDGYRYYDESLRYTVDLEPWETVIFPAYYFHEASPVLQGRRTILISWAQFESLMPRY